MIDVQFWQWATVLAFGLLFLLTAPLSRTVAEFFSATTTQGKTPNVLTLTSSLVISWVFAKSITNAAGLGMSYGIVGGVAYSMYYLSFLVAGVVLYQLRVRGGYTSIHHFLSTRFGHGAVVVFSLLVCFRLYNEVWSNTMVIGSYFGAAGSVEYYGAILAFTALTLAYTLKGGLRSSLMTDVIQMALFAVLLFIILALMLPHTPGGVRAYLHSGQWTMATGLNLLVVALIQVFSYPFHDSVMTDRAFISPPRVALRSFLWAAPIGVACIILFSTVGVFAQLRGLEGESTLAVGQLLGVAAVLVMNFIMITSAASTLDSAFASAAKLIVVDLGQPQQQSVRRGRWVMAAFAVLGTLPVFMNPEILSATTVSGTMVLGLAPVFVLWRMQAGAWAFHVSVATGIVWGLVLALGWWPAHWTFTTGKYADLLTVNLLATVMAFGLYWLFSKRK
jgi:Na+/proline symporter